MTSRLDYCNSLLLNTSKSNISKLPQNNLARVITRSAWRSDARPLLNQLHWLPIEDRIKFKIAVITHKVRSCTEPHYLSVLLKELDTVAIRQLRSGCQSLLVQPFVWSLLRSGTVWADNAEPATQFKKTAQDWTVRCACVSLGDNPSPWFIRVAPLRSFHVNLKVLLLLLLLLLLLFSHYWGFHNHSCSNSWLPTWFLQFSLGWHIRFKSGSPSACPEHSCSGGRTVANLGGGGG